MENETYHANITCQNCGEYNLVDVPKGTTISRYKKQHKCEKCGCYLEKDINNVKQLYN